MREQMESDNVVHEVCSLDEYMAALSAGNIRWNELYYISG